MVSSLNRLNIDEILRNMQFEGIYHRVLARDLNPVLNHVLDRCGIYPEIIFKNMMVERGDILCVLVMRAITSHKIVAF